MHNTVVGGWGGLSAGEKNKNEYFGEHKRGKKNGGKAFKLKMHLFG